MLSVQSCRKWSFNSQLYCFVWSYTFKTFIHLFWLFFSVCQLEFGMHSPFSYCVGINAKPTTLRYHFPLIQKVSCADKVLVQVRYNSCRFYTSSCYTEGIAFADKKPLWEVNAQDQQSICNLRNSLFKKRGNFSLYSPFVSGELIVIIGGKAWNGQSVNWELEKYPQARRYSYCSAHCCQISLVFKRSQKSTAVCKLSQYFKFWQLIQVYFKTPWKRKQTQQWGLPVWNPATDKLLFPFNFCVCSEEKKK